MIDAARFASAYGSIWRDLTPTADLFVRRVNLHLYERIYPPFHYNLNSSRSALVSETAFSLFEEHTRQVDGAPKFIERHLPGALHEARRRLTTMHVENISDDLDQEEWRATVMLFRRLAGFFRRRAGRIVVRPVFPGCGFIDQSEGDVICGDTLFEVKMVDRSYRSADIRQLITYAVLDYKSRAFSINRIALLNPRVGTSFEMGLDDLCKEISGVGSVELLGAIAYAVGSGDVSR